MTRSGDDILRQKVQEILDTNAKIKAYGLKADVVNGEIIINGIVDTLSEKENLRKLISGVEGVRSIENGIAISTDGAINDHEVTSEVLEELKADPNVDLKHVGAYSVNGTVFLKGRVDDESEIKAAEHAAAKARGVRDVVSQLKMETAKDLSLKEIFHSQVNNDEEEGEEGRF